MKYLLNLIASFLISSTVTSCQANKDDMDLVSMAIKYNADKPYLQETLNNTYSEISSSNSQLQLVAENLKKEEDQLHFLEDEKQNNLEDKTAIKKQIREEEVYISQLKKEEETLTKDISHLNEDVSTLKIHLEHN